MWIRCLYLVGMKLSAFHFVPGQYVDLQGTTYVVFFLFYITSCCLSGVDADAWIGWEKDFRA
jgi:hypothetical protein